MSWPKNSRKVIISGLLVEITADGYQTPLLLKRLQRLDPPHSLVCNLVSQNKNQWKAQTFMLKLPLAANSRQYNERDEGKRE